MDSLMKACEEVSILARHEERQEYKNNEWWGFDVYNSKTKTGVNVVIKPNAEWAVMSDRPNPSNIGDITVYTAIELLEALSEHGFAEVFARPDFVLEL